MRINKLAITIASTIVAIMLITAGIVVAVAHGSAAGSAASTTPDPLKPVRAATAPYQSLTFAQNNGYALLKDAAGIACIANPGVGAMGVHYVNGDLVKAGTAGQLDPNKPQAVVYEPDKNGNLHLVALEYVVFAHEWGISHMGPPELFGQEFMFTPEGNRFGLPAFYSLHVWLWKSNPTGMFSMWNPTVSCDSAITGSSSQTGAHGTPASPAHTPR